jgi:hypothetical protein
VLDSVNKINFIIYLYVYFICIVEGSCELCNERDIP